MKFCNFIANYGILHTIITIIMDGMESSQIITQPLVRQNSCMTLGLNSVFQNHETSPANACQGPLRFCQQLLPSQDGKVFVNVNFAMILQNM